MFSRNRNNPLIPIDPYTKTSSSPNSRRSQIASLAKIINQKQIQIDNMESQFRLLKLDINVVKQHLDGDQKDKLFGQMCYFETYLFRARQILNRARDDPDEYVPFELNNLLLSCKDSLQQMISIRDDGIRKRVYDQIREDDRQMRLERLRQRRNAMIVREI